MWQDRDATPSTVRDARDISLTATMPFVYVDSTHRRTSSPDSMATIGEKLRKARERAGISQRKLATELGVTYALVSRWEADDRNPTFNDVMRISKILCIKPGDLVEGVSNLTLTLRLSDMDSITLVQNFFSLSPFFRQRFLEFGHHFARISREAELGHEPTITESADSN